MNTYVVAYLSLFEGELKQEIVVATSEYLAMLTALKLQDVQEEYPDTESIYQYCANTDSYISALKI